VLYRALELTVSPTLRVLYQPDVVGLEHVPRTGPVIIAGNHVSFADEIFTPVAARRQVFYFAKAEYFNTPGIKGRSMAALFRAMRQLPVERADTRSAAASLDVGLDVLADGQALGIYPEGTRSPDGRLYKFRTGVARLALRFRGASRPGRAHRHPRGQAADRLALAPPAVGRSLRPAAGLLRTGGGRAQRPGPARGR